METMSTSKEKVYEHTSGTLDPESMEDSQSSVAQSLDTQVNPSQSNDSFQSISTTTTPSTTNGSFTNALIGVKRESDSDIHEEDEVDNEDDGEQEDPTRLPPVPLEDLNSYVQCPPIEQEFESWDAFSRAMEIYCVTTHQPMRLRTSDSAKAVNVRAAKRHSLKEPIDESIGFVKKLFLCTHGVKTKPRGKGKRPRQHYRYMGCPAMIRACISERKADDTTGKSKYTIRVVAQINKHNHRLSDHLYKAYTDTRVVFDDDLTGPISHGLQSSGNATTLTDANGNNNVSSIHSSSYQLPLMPSNVDQTQNVGSVGLDISGLKSANIVSSETMDLLADTRGKIRVGWIGAGIMGASMCSHILANGYEVTVYSRTSRKCNSLLEKGARVVNSVAEVGQSSGYPQDVRSVILDQQKGLLLHMKAGSIIVDMTTSEPALAKEIYSMAKLHGISTLDAPVSGGDIGAREAKLSIMVGGDTEAVNSAMPFFSIMGNNIRHMGGSGAGQHTKMVNQILIATNMIGVVEGLLYATKSGLDIEETILAVGAGAAGSWSINNMGPRIARRNFDPGFFVEHFIKDMGIALKEAQNMNLSLPGLALANQLYLSVKAQGHGRLGTQALMLALEKLNGMDRIINAQII